MISHRQDVPSFGINSIHLVNLQNLFLFYDQLFKVHWTWRSSFPNFNILMHVTLATYLSNWKFLGMEEWISQFYHSSMVITGCRMGTWCSLIKYCICNRVKCSLTYPCSKLSLPQEKGESWNVGYEVLLNKLQQKDRHQSPQCSYLCGMEGRMLICFKNQSMHFVISKYRFSIGFVFFSNNQTKCDFVLEYTVHHQHFKKCFSIIGRCPSQ